VYSDSRASVGVCVRGGYDVVHVQSERSTCGHRKRHMHGHVCTVSQPLQACSILSRDCTCSSSATAVPPPAPLFGSHAGLHTPLPLVQRSAIVTLHKDGQSHATVAQKVGTSLPALAVSRWVARYEDHKDVTEEKHGRPRCTDEALDTAIAFAGHVDNFTSPRQLKRKLNLDVSSDKVDRRLKEAGLYGRVARHLVSFTAEHKHKRLAFAQRYKGWTEAQWESVLFHDETIFTGAGFSGQRWVRRPRGDARITADT
jgi:transposase